MFISKAERMEIGQRLFVLEEMVKGMNGKINLLESTLREKVVIDKKTLLIQAEELRMKQEKKREYSRRYYEKVKVKKAAQ